MPTTAAVTADSPVPDTQQLAALVQAQANEIAQLRAQVAWFQRQLFGRKSEKRLVETDAAQGTLGEAFDAVPDTPAPGKRTRVAGHERTAAPNRPAGDESTLFFDENKVPVEVRGGPGKSDSRISDGFASQSRPEGRIQEQQHDQENKTEPLRQFQGKSGLGGAARR